MIGIDTLTNILSANEVTRNVLDKFRAQRAFRLEDKPAATKTIRAVYRRFNGEVTLLC